MSKYAIIVIDVLNEFVTGAIAFNTGQAVVEPIAKLTNKARKSKIPVIYANDTHISGEDKELELWGDHALAGTKGAEVVSELTPRNGDYVVSKRSYSAFFKTNLDLLLKELEVDTLIVTGLYVHLACRQTVVDAYNLGYGIIVPRETTAAFPDDDLEKNLDFLRDKNMVS